MSLRPPPQSSRVALVEDHTRLAALVSRGLAAEGILVDLYGELESAWRGLSERSYAAAIIDRGLPDGDGMDLVRRLRSAGSSLPCILLTARDALRDRVDGLDAGADDYLAKPFALEELVARVKALMRRLPEFQRQVYSQGDVVLQPDDGCMRVGDDLISLAPAELQIMACLMRANGQTVRRSALEDAAWGISTPVTPNALDVAIHRLRKKLSAIGSTLSIGNVRSLGFALREE